MFVGLVTQLWSPSNVCVERGYKLCAYIKLVSSPDPPYDKRTRERGSGEYTTTS